MFDASREFDVSQPFGISAGGRTAEKLYRQITGARAAPRASDGDAEFDGHLVEVKKASKVTINQVRAVKYIPLVVYFEPEDQPGSAEWYVVPAHVVVAGVSQKSRGQHTENPFESATLNVRNLHAYRVEEANLRRATLAAIEQSERFPQLKEAMAGVLHESREVVLKSLERVRQVLHEIGLEASSL